MSSSNARELAENKLILLYFIDKINMPISNLQLTKVFLENRFMNYFYLQHCLTDLCNDGNISCENSGGKSFYSITPDGKKTLGFFTGMIPVGIKKRIDDTVSDIRKNIRNETHISADYTPVSDREFVVECRVNEDSFTLMDLKITVGSRSDAIKICENWEKHSQSIYSEIIQSLIKQRDS